MGSPGAVAQEEIKFGFAVIDATPRIEKIRAMHLCLAQIKDAEALSPANDFEAHYKEPIAKVRQLAGCPEGLTAVVDVLVMPYLRNYLDVNVVKLLSGILKDHLKYDPGNREDVYRCNPHFLQLDTRIKQLEGVSIFRPEAPARTEVEDLLLSELKGILKGWVNPYLTSPYS